MPFLFAVLLVGSVAHAEEVSVSENKSSYVSAALEALPGSGLPKKVSCGTKSVDIAQTIEDAKSNIGAVYVNKEKKTVAFYSKLGNFTSPTVETRIYTSQDEQKIVKIEVNLVSPGQRNVGTLVRPRYETVMRVETACK